MRVPIELFGVVVLSASAAGCILDLDQPCGPHQILTEQESCICDDTSIWNAARDGCDPCRFDEVRVGEACVCREGFVRGSDGINCLPPAPDAGIVDASVPVETPVDVPDPGCTDHADCPEGAYCRAEGAEAMCRPVPTGMGEPCGSSADCAAFDADYCVPQGAVCLVAGCSATPDDCPPDWGCCLLSTFGLEDVCVPVGTCPL